MIKDELHDDEGLLSLEKLDRASPDLWPEKSKYALKRNEVKTIVDSLVGSWPVKRIIQVLVINNLDICYGDYDCAK